MWNEKKFLYFTNITPTFWTETPVVETRKLITYIEKRMMMNKSIQLWRQRHTQSPNRQKTCNLLGKMLIFISLIHLLRGSIKTHICKWSMVKNSDFRQAKPSSHIISDYPICNCFYNEYDSGILIRDFLTGTSTKFGILAALVWPE